MAAREGLGNHGGLFFAGWPFVIPKLYHESGSRAPFVLLVTAFF
jgi:hypothetical protein